jgi:chemotaxis protein methyltransferase CheR
MYRESGVVLDDSKRTMVEGRLHKRLLQSGCPTWRAYLSFAQRPGSAELTELVNCLTTNKTSFFRESHHFDVLRSFLKKCKAAGQRKIRIWSSACSSGQEPYTMAMVAREELGDFAVWDLRILASDIDTNILAKAENGIYTSEQLGDLPPAQRCYFEPLPDGTHRIVDELREVITFRRINLIERPWPIRTSFDIVFCRNVMIYFDRPTQRGIIEAQCGLLKKEGLYFAGHSENLVWLADILAPVGGTVYRNKLTPRGGTGSDAPPNSEKALPSVPPAVKRVPITIGGVHATRAPCLITTVLGSCVAVCLYDPETGVGGMNHFMLVEPPKGTTPREDPLPARFGTHAMSQLVNAVIAHGGVKERLVAKVFGAAHVLSGMDAQVPEDNAAFVLRYLSAEKIPVVAQRLGGDSPMLLHFDLGTGRALVRLIEKDERERVRSEEEAVCARLRAEAS